MGTLKSNPIQRVPQVTLKMKTHVPVSQIQGMPTTFGTTAFDCDREVEVEVEVTPLSFIFYHSRVGLSGLSSPQAQAQDLPGAEGVRLFKASFDPTQRGSQTLLVDLLQRRRSGIFNSGSRRICNSAPWALSWCNLPRCNLLISLSRCQLSSNSAGSSRRGCLVHRCRRLVHLMLPCHGRLLHRVGAAALMTTMMPPSSPHLAPNHQLLLLIRTSVSLCQSASERIRARIHQSNP